MSTSADAGTGLAALYQERILEHYRRPRHKETLVGATGTHTVKNPLCGDEITVAVRMTGDRVDAAAFTGTGCSITQATASMLMTLAAARDVASLRSLGEAFDAMLHGTAPVESLGELQALVGVAAFPARHKCARLPWSALFGAIDASRAP